MSRKTFRLDRSRDLFLEIQPTGFDLSAISTDCGTLIGVLRSPQRFTFAVFKGWVTSDLHATKVSRFLIFISARCRWFTNTGPRSP